MFHKNIRREILLYVSEYVNPITPQGMGLFCPSIKTELKTPLKRGFKGLKCSAKIFAVQFYYKSLNMLTL